DGTLEHRNAPVAVATSEQFVAIEAGLFHTCALTAAGEAWRRRHNPSDGTGTGLPELDVLVPTKGARGHVFTSRAAGDAQARGGSTAAGEAWCWGRGPVGEDGVTERDTPGLVAGGHAFAAVSVGDHRGCGVTATGEALCWESGTEPAPAAP